MLDLLRKNYGLTLWLTRAILGLSVILGHWFFIDSFFAAMSSAGIIVPRAWYVYLLYAFISVIVIELISRVFIKCAFNLAKIYVIPFSEFIILFLAAVAVINIISGSVKLLYLLTPAMFVFGEALITFVISAGVFFGLFLIVKKFYLNDKNAPYIFKISVWIFLGLSVINAFIF